MIKIFHRYILKIIFNVQKAQLIFNSKAWSVRKEGRAIRPLFFLQIIKISSSPVDCWSLESLLAANLKLLITKYLYPFVNCYLHLHSEEPSKDKTAFHRYSLFKTSQKL